MDMTSANHSTSHSESEIGDTFVFAYNGEIVLKILPTASSPRSSQYHEPINPSKRSDSHDDFLSDNESRRNSRSLSRAPSVSAAMSGSLSRKASRTSLMSRRSSLPSITRGPSLMHCEHKPDASLMVAISGGTLDRLIDVLIDGLEVTVSSTDDSGLSVGTTKTLSVDKVDFQKSWWATFRSFVSAFVFFEV